MDEVEAIQKSLKDTADRLAELTVDSGWHGYVVNFLEFLDARAANTGEFSDYRQMLGRLSTSIEYRLDGGRWPDDR